MSPEEAINRVARDMVERARKEGRPLTFTEARETVRRARARGEAIRANDNR